MIKERSLTETFLLRQSIRKYMRLQRKLLTPKQQSTASHKVMRRILTDKRIKKANNIALFLSFDGELNTRPLIDALWYAGKQVYLPVLHPFTAGHLLFLRYSALTPLVLNRIMPVYEPQLDITTLLLPQQLDIIFTPLVAFDRLGQRLGMGGGFYDRTLQNWHIKNRFLPIGIAHDCQKTIKTLPVEKWDISLPEIITPSCHWSWR